jgi:hypothetical protein
MHADCSVGESMLEWCDMNVAREMEYAVVLIIEVRRGSSGQSWAIGSTRRQFDPRGSMTWHIWKDDERYRRLYCALSKRVGRNSRQVLAPIRECGSDGSFEAISRLLGTTSYCGIRRIIGVNMWRWLAKDCAMCGKQSGQMQAKRSRDTSARRA